MDLILVLYTDGLFLTRNEPLMFKVKGKWPLKVKMKNHGMMSYVLKLGKENICSEAVKESGNAKTWTL